MVPRHHHVEYENMNYQQYNSRRVEHDSAMLTRDINLQGLEGSYSSQGRYWYVSKSSMPKVCISLFVCCIKRPGDIIEVRGRNRNDINIAVLYVNIYIEHIKTTIFRTNPLHLPTEEVLQKYKNQERTGQHIVVPW